MIPITTCDNSLSCCCCCYCYCCLTSRWWCCCWFGWFSYSSIHIMIYSYDFDVVVIIVTVTMKTHLQNWMMMIIHNDMVIVINHKTVPIYMIMYISKMSHNDDSNLFFYWNGCVFSSCYCTIFVMTCCWRMSVDGIYFESMWNVPIQIII